MGERLSRFAPLLWIGGGALLLCFVFGHGFANYDTFYSLVWGDQLANGNGPDYDAALSPTPHPLATVFGLLVSPLGDSAETAAVAVGFISLAAIGYLVYRLGELWLNRWVGLLAAAIVLTREPVLDYGSRAYVDLPYIALVLGALLLIARQPRSGWPPLALLGVAGLLRPEAWLFAAVYLLYLAYTQPGRPEGRLAPLASLFRPGELLGLSLLAAAAPLLWTAFDLAVTGDPLHSLTGTQDTVDTLRRDTGLVDAITKAPRRIGEVLREPVLLGAAGGVLFIWALLRPRAGLGIAAVAVALGTFLILATAGLAVITRYLLLASILLAILAAAGALGWLSLERDNPWRTRWAVFGAVVILALLVFAPRQYERLSDLQDRVAAQEQIRDDLHDLVDESGFGEGCRASITDYQGVPLLALWLELRPSTVASAEPLDFDGYLFYPADPEVAELFALDRNAPSIAEIPATGRPTDENRSWRSAGRCRT